MRFVILVIVVVVAVAAGLLLLKVANQPAGPQVAATGAQDPAAAANGGAGNVATVDVMVARVDIPLGTVVNESMVDRQPWPKHLLLDGFITAEQPGTQLVGMVARSEFKAREPFIKSKLAKPNDASFLASALPKGMRAVTVSVDAVSGVAGYIFPGDHVDVLLAHSVPQDAATRLWGEQAMGGGEKKPTTAEVLVPNLKVLAINLRGSSQQPPDDSANNNGAPPRVEPPSTVTLEVSQDDAKKLRLAEKNGTMSLALRSLRDEDDASTGVPITLLDLSRVEGGEYDKGGSGWRNKAKSSSARGQGQQEPQDSVVIIRGTKSEQTMMPPMGQRVDMPPMMPPGM